MFHRPAVPLEKARLETTLVNRFNDSLPESALTRSRIRFEATHPKKKNKAEILIEIVTAEPNAWTVAELAEAAERSVGWVRKQLRIAGLTDAVKSTMSKSVISTSGATTSEKPTE